MKAFGLTPSREATKGGIPYDPALVHTPVADTDFAHSGDIDDSQESWMYIDVSGPGTVRFSWKVSSEQNCDYLQFSTDGQLLSSISGTQNWNQVSFSVTGSGTHRLRWRYVKDSSVSSGSDCGWVKAVVWEPTPPPGMALGKAVDSLLTYTTGETGFAPTHFTFWGVT